VVNRRVVNPQAVGRVGAEMGRRAANRPQKQPSIKALDSAVLSDAQRKTF